MNKIIEGLGGNDYKLGHGIKQTQAYKTRNRTLPFCIEVTPAAQVWDKMEWMIHKQEEADKNKQEEANKNERDDEQETIYDTE